MKKLSRLAVMLALVLALTACSGGADTPSPDEQTEGQHPVTDAAELEGQWTSPSGNILSFSADQGRYTYQTFSGRTGQGPYDAAADVPTIDFDGFLYDFILRDDGVLLPNQNGSGGDVESIDHFTFRRSSDARIDLWELSDLSGVWQNALGETLVIDADRMAYLSYTRLSMGSGTIGDDQDGKGPYLAMNGRIYLSPGLDKDRFTLLGQDADGSFSGVFYPYGQAAAYTALPGASFETDEDGYCRWYSDGHDAFYITGSYTLAEDGLAYRDDGPVYAAGFDPILYDPAEDWGESWMSNCPLCGERLKKGSTTCRCGYRETLAEQELLRQLAVAGDHRGPVSVRSPVWCRKRGASTWITAHRIFRRAAPWRASARFSPASAWSFLWPE